MTKGGRQPGAGRPKGAKNKRERVAKEDALGVFYGLGGAENMLKWARNNETEYYTKVFPKLLPKDIDIKTDGAPLVPVLNIGLSGNGGGSGS